MPVHVRLEACLQRVRVPFRLSASLFIPQGYHSHWVWQSRYNPFHDQLVLVRISALCALRSAQCACLLQGSAL